MDNAKPDTVSLPRRITSLPIHTRRKASMAAHDFLSDAFVNDLHNPSCTCDKDAEIDVPETLENVGCGNELNPLQRNQHFLTEDDEVDTNCDDYMGEEGCAFISEDELNVGAEGSEMQFDDSISSDGSGEEKLSKKLREWSLRYNVSHCALTSLLHILHPLDTTLPLCSKTLLLTPRTTKVKVLTNGQYSHLGLTKGLLKKMKSGLKSDEKAIGVYINIDGFKVFKSCREECWPLLCKIRYAVDTSPFAVGVFYGKGKPLPLQDYLHDFITEVEELSENGLFVNDVHYQFYVHCYVCDAPARAYLKCIKGHTSINGCEKCDQEGRHNGKMVVFSDKVGNLRTDDSFNSRSDPEHHRGDSPLERICKRPVTQFVLDFMHLGDLGVTKRFFTFILERGPPQVRLNSRAINLLSYALVDSSKWIPCEFSRRLRSLDSVAQWKATEWRQMLLYVGPVLLKDVLPSQVYKYSIVHFIGDNSVQAVPTKWVQGEACFWPAKGCPRRSINEYVDPPLDEDASWCKLEARVLRTFDSKEKACSFLEHFTMHSNLDTENEGDRKEERRKKARKRWPSESSEDLEMLERLLERKKTPAKKNINSMLPERPRVMLTHGSHSAKQKDLNLDELPGTSTSSCNRVNSHSSRLSLSEKVTLNRSSLDIRTPPHSEGMNKILAEILRNQKIILATLAEHGEILNNLQRISQDVGKTSKPQGWPARMPLSCLQDFNEWETFLKNEDNHSFAVDYFSVVGGDNCGDMCRRIMRKVFTAELSAKFNIQGSEKKKGLKSTGTLKVIQGACRRHFQDLPLNNIDKETVYAIGKWLRNQCPKTSCTAPK